MERKRANYAVKKEARRLYEVDGLSDKKIGNALGFHPNTVAGWRKNEGWATRGSLKAAPPDFNELPTTTESTEAEVEIEPTVTNESEVEILRARITELQADKERLAAEVEEFRPDVDISVMLFQNEQDLADVFDEQHWKDQAQRQFSAVNQQRRVEGLELLKFTDEELENEIVRLKTEELASRRKPADGPPDKRIKMVKPNEDGSYFPPHIVSLPYESQVNNVAGSLADGLVIYTQKKFKLTRPFLCPRRKCFKPAALDLNMKWAHDGYCSYEHYVEVEKPQNANPMTGVTIKDAVGAITR